LKKINKSFVLVMLNTNKYKVSRQFQNLWVFLYECKVNIVMDVTLMTKWGGYFLLYIVQPTGNSCSIILKTVRFLTKCCNKRWWSSSFLMNSFSSYRHVRFFYNVWSYIPFACEYDLLHFYLTVFLISKLHDVWYVKDAW